MQTCTIKLDKSYKLSFGNRALRVFEADGGRSIGNAMAEFGVSTVTYLIHAGMAYDYPDITIEEVDDKLDAFLDGGGEISPIAEKLSKAVTASGWFVKANPTTKPDSPSGKDSGETPAE